MKLLLLTLSLLAIYSAFDFTGQYQVLGHCNKNACPNTSFLEEETYFECPTRGPNNAYISHVGKQFSLEMKVDSGYMSGKYVQKYFDDSDIGFNPLHPEQEQIQIPMTDGYVMILQPCITADSHQSCPEQNYQKHIIGWKKRMGQEDDSCEFDLLKTD